MMKRIAATALTFTLTTGAQAQEARAPIPEAVGRAAPALGAYSTDVLFGGIWQGPELSGRDRGLVTVAALIARNQTGDLPEYMALALDAGLTPAELSEAITHLAFYSGWGNATAAAEAAAVVYDARGIPTDALPGAEVEKLPLDAAAEATRQERVSGQFADVSQGVVDNTEQVVFLDLWLRPGLAPRDRSLVTVAALVSAGQSAQIGYHLGRAMDNGLTKPEVAGLLSHLAFYAGWPNVFSAMPVAKEVLEARG